MKVELQHRNNNDHAVFDVTTMRLLKSVGEFDSTDASNVKFYGEPPYNRRVELSELLWGGDILHILFNDAEYALLIDEMEYVLYNE